MSFVEPTDYFRTQKYLTECEISKIDDQLANKQFLSAQQIKIFKRRRAKLNKEVQKLKKYVS